MNQNSRLFSLVASLMLVTVFLMQVMRFLSSGDQGLSIIDDVNIRVTPLSIQPLEVQETIHDESLHPNRQQKVTTESEELTWTSNEADGDGYFKLSREQRFRALKAEIDQFARTPITCATKFIVNHIFCDANPGNGLRNVIKGAVVGFVLGRMPITKVFRKAECDRYIDARRPELFIAVDEDHTQVLKKKGCPVVGNRPRKLAKFGQNYSKSYACLVPEQDDPFVEYSDSTTNIYLFADMEFNKGLTKDQRSRIRRLTDIGMFTATGLLMDALFEISSKVTKEFEGDYFPGEALMAKLRDESVLKIGLHVRHLPFVVRDENGPEGIDKRAVKCLRSSVAQTLQAKPSKGCLVLVATDMNSRREQLLQDIRALDIKCETFMIHRTKNESSEWGGESYSDWETRDPHKDMRSVMEAYLDMFVLSEFSNFIVFPSGSTFSQLIAFRNAKREDVVQNVEFASSSCKDQYFLYPLCCHTRTRFDDISLVTRKANVRCEG